MIRIRYGVLFKGLFVVMCVMFVLELGYFSRYLYERKQYIAGIHIPAGPEEMTEDMYAVEKPEPVPEETFRIVRKSALSMDTILDRRDPFSDVTFRQGAERQRAQELEEFWSQRHYSILKDKPEKKEDVISFAYIVKERPPLPPPVLDSIEIEGMPKESLTAPVKQESPFKWKGTLMTKGQAYHFIGNEKKDYAVGSGERIEGYRLQKEEGGSLLMEKDGEMYAVERK